MLDEGGPRPLDHYDRLPSPAAVGAGSGDHPRGGVVSFSALRQNDHDPLRDAAPDAGSLHPAGHADVVTAQVVALTPPVDELVGALPHRFGTPAVATITGGTR